MKIDELKSKVENNNFDSISMVWQLTDLTSKIIAEQYIHMICKNNGLSIKYIDDLNDIPDKSFIEDTNLYVLNVDKFGDDNKYDNCIILCNKCDYKDVIKIPKLEDWQVVDYLMSKVPALNRDELSWLMTKYDGNYLRLINDIEKLSIFNVSQQKALFEQFVRSGEYDHISNLKVWDLSNAILKKDKKMIREVLSVLDYIDVEPIGLHTVLYNNFKNVINVQINPSVTAKELGISDKQLWVIKKYNCGFYNKEQLVKIFELLTNIEYMYKFGGLQISNLIDYMIVKILEV